MKTQRMKISRHDIMRNWSVVGRVEMQEQK